MRTPDPLAPPELSATVNEALLLVAEGLGARTAVELRSELRALGAASSGRLVVAGEPDQGALEVIADLIGLPGLAPTLALLPRVHTTYRFGPDACVVLCTSEGEEEVAIDSTGGCPDLEVVRLGLPGRLQQIDVCVPWTLLSSFAVVHLPDLHGAGLFRDPLLGLTAETTLVYVTSAAMPLAAVEVGYLAEAGRRVGRVAVVLTETERYAAWRAVAAVNAALVEATGEPVTVVGPNDLARWLFSAPSSSGALAETLGLVAGVMHAMEVQSQRAATAPDRDVLAERLGQAEAHAALVGRETMTWLPRLSHEFARLRSRLGETVARSLAQLEQRHDQWVQSDVNEATERMPAVLLDDLRDLERRLDQELIARLDVVADQFLGSRREEFLPGGVRNHVAVPDGRVGLVGVAQVHSDVRNELFASLGNVASGRQSLSLVSSVATAAAAPVALVGGILGLGFWRLGRSTRQDSLARAQAGRWLKVQLGEAARVMRFRIDQVLNDAQLVMNLAVRDHHDRMGAEARRSVEVGRQAVAQAEATLRLEVDRATARASRAGQLRDLAAPQRRSS